MITLISPQKLISASSQFYIGRGGAPPLNLAYLARVLDNNKIEYQVIDTLATPNHFHLDKYKIKAHGLTIEETVRRIDPKVKIVGLSSMFTNEFFIIRELISKIKEAYPDVIIILGGEHPTAMADATLKYEDHVDYIFYGEAESSLVQFVLNYKENKDLKSTPGIYYRDSDGKVLRNESAGRLIAIDDHLPLWDKFPINYYLDNKLSLSRIGVRSLPILATRGCPYKCTFCSNENMWGTRYVMRSIDSVINEMKSYIEAYQVEHFDFQDLSTSINKNWFVSLLKRMKEELPKITWEMTVGTRSEILDLEVLTLLRDSGTTQLTYAPETGSYELSKRIKKKLNYKKLYDSIEIANQLRMQVKAHLIIGFPSETFLDLIKTLFMGLNLGWRGVKGVSIYVFSPYPGSELFNQAYNQEKFTKVEYDNFLTYQLRNHAGARVFNPKNVILHPREESLAFLANSFMVFSYFLSMVRFPRRLMDLFLNPLKGKPKNPIEIGLHSFLKKIR